MTPDKRITRDWVRLAIVLFYILAVLVVKSWAFAGLLLMLCYGMDWSMGKALEEEED